MSGPQVSGAVIREVGLPDGLQSIARVLPAADVKRIHDAFAAALATPQVRAQMDERGQVIQPTTPQAAVQYFRTEQER